MIFNHTTYVFMAHFIHCDQGVENDAVYALLMCHGLDDARHTGIKGFNSVATKAGSSSDMPKDTLKRFVKFLCDRTTGWTSEASLALEILREKEHLGELGMARLL